MARRVTSKVTTADAVSPGFSTGYGDHHLLDTVLQSPVFHVADLGRHFLRYKTDALFRPFQGYGHGAQNSAARSAARAHRHAGLPTLGRLFAKRRRLRRRWLLLGPSRGSLRLKLTPCRGGQAANQSARPQQASYDIHDGHSDNREMRVNMTPVKARRSPSRSTAIVVPSSAIGGRQEKRRPALEGRVGITRCCTQGGPAQNRDRGTRLVNQ